jgi:hypothetical protein
VVFLGAVPILSAVVLMLWFVQVVGMLQVGVYLEGLENALRSELPDAPPQVLTWETSLREDARRVWQPRYDWVGLIVIALFTVIAGASILLGAYRGYADHPETVVAVASVEAVVFLLFAGGLVREAKGARKRAAEKRAVEVQQVGEPTSRRRSRGGPNAR